MFLTALANASLFIIYGNIRKTHILYTNIDQTLMNSLHRLLNC